MSHDRWLVTPERRRFAEIRLFALPYAGGSAGSFRSWAKRLCERVELNILQLPGREDRFAEPFMTRMDEMVPQIAAAIEERSDKPFVIYGHSVGALMGYEVTRRLQARGAQLPQHLIVSGKRAPHVPIQRKPMHELADAELVDRLRHFGGTPQTVLDTPELLDLFLPRMRADFQINETYRHIPGPSIPCPVTVFGGSDDPETTRETLVGWSDHVSGRFDLRMYPGGHFFIHQFEDRVLGDIQQLTLAALAHVAGCSGKMPLPESTVSSSKNGGAAGVDAAARLSAGVI